MKQTILLLFTSLSLSLGVYGQQTDNIKLNQLGFYKKGPKLAFVTQNESLNRFYIISENSRDTVFEGNLGPAKKSSLSSTITKVADFSKFTKEGVYCVFVPGLGNSNPFTVGDKVSLPAAKATLKGFYYQRVSMPLEERFAGKWHRPAGHPDTAVFIHPSATSKGRPEGFKISSPGGWYDAGDYNKYIVNSGITMGTLLSAYEDFPSYFDTLDTNIPESANRVPDILDEVVYNLRWMLTMQDRHDGGVYNKCTNASFDGMVMPGVTKAARYVVQKGTGATLDFAAVTAQAGRILKKFDRELPGLSDSCLVAAERAWLWAKQNPDSVYNQNELNRRFTPKITTGGYGDRNFNDELFWAASELYCSTKKEAYLKDLEKGFANSLSLPSWANVHMLGIYSLSRNKKNLPSGLKAQVSNAELKVIQLADSFIQKSKESAFQTVIGQSARDFEWGSNAVASNQGILLTNAYLITKNSKYINAALSNLDYLLGRNATGYSFITGIGSKPTLNPHHRPSVADKITEPVPGLLAGGPNPGRQDTKGGLVYQFTEPETAYVDDYRSYASNEIAINWNAPVVYLSNAIEALQTQIGK